MSEHKPILTKFAVGPGTVVHQYGEYFRVTRETGWKIVGGNHYCVATLSHLGGSEWFDSRPLTGRNAMIVDILDAPAFA